MMKILSDHWNEKWNSFLNEAKAPLAIDSIKNKLEFDNEGDIILYHISSVSNIEILDPEIAAQNLKIYTTQEYRTWDRHRVFYFTKLGQEDTGIGRIEGYPYAVKLDPLQLYPIAEDPFQLSAPLEVQAYMIDKIPEFAAEYEEAEKCSSSKGYSERHICNETPDSDGLAWVQPRHRRPALLIDNPRYHHKKPNVYEMVANIAEESYNMVGFVYPQSGKPDNLIVALWRKMPAKRLNKDFYQQEGA